MQGLVIHSDQKIRTTGIFNDVIINHFTSHSSINRISELLAARIYDLNDNRMCSSPEIALAADANAGWYDVISKTRGGKERFIDIFMPPEPHQPAEVLAKNFYDRFSLKFPKTFASLGNGTTVCKVFAADGAPGRVGEKC